MTEITLPGERLGDETEAEVVRWLVDDGAQVVAGQAIVELSTAKIVFEINAPRAGRLTHRAAAGDLVPAGGSLATVRGD